MVKDTLDTVSPKIQRETGSQRETTDASLLAALVAFRELPRPTVPTQPLFVADQPTMRHIRTISSETARPATTIQATDIAPTATNDTLCPIKSIRRLPTVNSLVFLVRHRTRHGHGTVGLKVPAVMVWLAAPHSVSLISEIFASRQITALKS